MTDLARKIKLSEAVIEKLENLYESNKNEILLLSDKCGNSFTHLKGKDPLICLAVVLTLAVRVKDRYDTVGISENIYYDTMSDIKIWTEKNGDKGLVNYQWLKNHVSFGLFRIGRLQFQLYECKNRTLVYKKLPFNFGDKLIYIHIPEGEKLLKQQCVSSLHQANAFFSEFFPEYSYEYYFCESWLLYEGNREFMTDKSNIISFMSLFDLCYSIKIDKQAIERIFSKRRLIKKNYPENTSLQKQAKEYILSGKRLGIGVGVIERTAYGSEESSVK